VLAVSLYVHRQYTLHDGTSCSNTRRSSPFSLALAGSLLASATSAFAFDCIVADKPTGAGSVATIDVNTGQVTPNKNNPGTEEKPHGGFVTLTGLPTGTVDTYAHAPTKAQAPQAQPGVNPGASKQESQGRGCDGKGKDTIESCLGR
jgi:hypothetical protein